MIVTCICQDSAAFHGVSDRSAAYGGGDDRLARSVLPNTCLTSGTLIEHAISLLQQLIDLACTNPRQGRRHIHQVVFVHLRQEDGVQLRERDQCREHDERHNGHRGFGEMLKDEPIAVFIAPLLPRSVRIGKVAFRLQSDGAISDVKDLTTTQEFARIHFASAAAWWKPVPYNAHAHSPETTAEIQKMAIMLTRLSAR